MKFSVKQARKYRGLTQSDVAEQMGISTYTYRSIELHPEKTTVERALAFSSIVDMPIDNIFFINYST